MGPSFGEPVRCRAQNWRYDLAGNSIFFSVKRIEDPIGLLPAKLILGINKVILTLQKTAMASQMSSKTSAPEAC